MSSPSNPSTNAKEGSSMVQITGFDQQHLADKLQLLLKKNNRKLDHFIMVDDRKPYYCNAQVSTGEGSDARYAFDLSLLLCCISVLN
jgi:hypothetical protein